MNWNTCCNLLT